MEERAKYLIEWYRDELGSLLNYLEDKEPFSDEDIKQCRDWLIEIKDQMKEYRDETEDVSFKNALSNCLSSLPNPMTNPAEWHDSIFKSVMNLKPQQISKFTF